MMAILVELQIDGDLADLDIVGDLPQTLEFESGTVPRHGDVIIFGDVVWRGTVRPVGFRVQGRFYNVRDEQVFSVGLMLELIPR